MVQFTINTVTKHGTSLTISIFSCDKGMGVFIILLFLLYILFGKTEKIVIIIAMLDKRYKRNKRLHVRQEKNRKKQLESQGLFT